MQRREKGVIDTKGSDSSLICTFFSARNSSALVLAIFAEYLVVISLGTILLSQKKKIQKFVPTQTTISK